MMLDLLITAMPPSTPSEASIPEQMAKRLDATTGRQFYRLRKQTVESVFGIIKQGLGFRRFLLRGQEEVSLEWSLVSTSYNLKQLFNLGMKLGRA